MEIHSSARVAVIGAGIAGLAAAYTLKQAGVAASVFEKADFVGGRMSSEVVEGFLFEKAAYTFPEFHKNLKSLLTDLGMGDCLFLSPGEVATIARGEEHRIKIGDPTDLLRYKLLSLSSKKDLLKMFLYAKSLGSKLDLANPTTKTIELESQSAADYILENYNREILEFIVYPIFCETFLGEPEGNSKAALLATLKNLGWIKISSFTEGMSMLPERLALELDVSLSTPVLSVRALGEGSRFAVKTGGARPEDTEFDGVVFATPAPLIPGLLEELPQDLCDRLALVRYSPSIVAGFAVDRTYKDKAFINNLCRDDYRTLGTIAFDDQKGPGRMPEGKGLVSVILSERASRELLSEPEDKIMDRITPEMDKALPGFSDKVLFWRVYRWEHGAVQLPPGTLAAQQETRRRMEGLFPRVAFAGDGLHKSSLEVSYNSGVSAARKLIESIPN